MPRPGWNRLLEGRPWFEGAGAFPIAAYSEFLPPPRYGVSPYGATGPSPLDEDDPWGWRITEHEEAIELRPGLQQVADQIVLALRHLVRGESAEGLARSRRIDNPYWPPALAEHAGALGHERFVILAPLALSRTRDDKGRDRWTLFGGSELGPARSFWRSFFSTPKRERPAEEARAFLRRLLATAHGGPAERWDDLYRAGFRVLPQGDLAPPLPRWSEGPLPSWTGPYLWKEGQSARGVRYLLTFRPFGALPEALQRAYRAGKLHLLPFPGSLVFWGPGMYLQLRHELPLALQVPLLNLIERREGPEGLRVPQSGWLHESGPDGASVGDHHGPIRNAFRRTHRSERTGPSLEDRVALVLFDSSEAIGLYGKPMARNAQVWTIDGRLLLDGPAATRDALDRAAEALLEGGLFGYRFQYPAMRIGLHEVYWHRPVVACLPEGAEQSVVLDNAPLGHLIAYPADRAEAGVTLELWPRMLDREPYQTAEALFQSTVDARPHQTAGNCRKLLDARTAFDGQALPRSFARRLLALPDTTTLDEWLDEVPARAEDPARGRRLADELRRGLETEPTPPPASVTFTWTARRSFEVAYWNTIKALSGGRFPNRNNADCARDPLTHRALTHDRRDLDALGDELLVRHAVAIASAGMKGRAFVGSLPFHWRTDFDFLWSDGSRTNQGLMPRERDLIVVIPGRDRSRAIIMADHYDTAYMEDRYGEGKGGGGPRLATPGADDNTSATAALLLAAPVLLDLCRADKLGCDVWLVHLTGEEFPADCLGAARLAQRLVEGTLTVRQRNGRPRDLSATRVEGIYVLDMVAHDNPRHRGVFQIAPGANHESMRLAYHAHRANEAWNAAVPIGNTRPARRHEPRRGPTVTALPPTARHPIMHGEVRPPGDPRSTLFNTDGQIFSDAGIPVVLFMEDYDIDRTGYHDSHDTMAGIDLDYGAALVAIAIEAVARAAGAGS